MMGIARIDGRCVGPLIAVILLLALGTALALPPVTQNLLVALDGSDVTTSGASVTSWNDQAALGGAQNFLPGTAPTLLSSYAMPSGSTHRVVSFNGVNSNLQVTSDPAFDTNTLSWFLVVQPDTTNAVQVLLRTDYTSRITAWGNIQASGSSRVYSEGRTSVGLQVAIYSPGFFWKTNRWYVLSTVLDGGSGAIRAKFVDHLGNTATPSATTANATLTGHINTRLGRHAGSQYLFAGRMAEVLIYKSALSVDDQESVLSYLVKKYFAPPSPPIGTCIMLR